MPQFDRTPDGPDAFGYKISWFAVKTSEPVAVLDALALGEATPCNWSSGLAAAYGKPGSGERWVFVSPAVGGWVLAISGRWPYPTGESHHDIGARFDATFSRLTTRFSDVQFFGSHRVADFACWARARDGAPTRIFSYGDGQVLMNFGDQTPEEAELGLIDLTGLSPQDAVDNIFSAAEEEDNEDGRPVFPDEEAVVELAALWSLDPMQLEDDGHPPGLGWAVRLPGEPKR